MSEEKNSEVEMLDEYDFSQAVIGKYAKQYAEGTNIVVLDPDVAKVFLTLQLSIKLCAKTSSSVLVSSIAASNEALQLTASVRRLCCGSQGESELKIPAAYFVGRSTRQKGV